MPRRERTTAKKRKAATPITKPESQHTVIPVTAEELTLSKQQVTTGKVRITKQVTERIETLDEPVYREEVEVERVPVEQIVDTPPEVRVEGDTTIIPVVEEVYIVEKRFRIKEEVRVRRVQKEASSPQQVKLRSEEVKVERVGSEDRGAKKPVS